MLSALKNCYENLVIRRPKTVLLAVLILVVAAALGLPRFKLDASADALTLETDQALDYFREISKRYASGDFLVVTYRYRNGDLFDADSLTTLRRLRDELAQVDGVTGVQTILDVPLLYSPKMSISEISDGLRTLSTPGTDKDLARQEFLSSPIYRDLILSPDGQTTALLASLALDERGIELVRERDALRRKRNAEGLTEAEAARLDEVSEIYLKHRTEQEQRSRARVEEVRGIIDRYKGEAELFLGGVSMISADMIAFIKSDLVVFGVGILLFIIATLLIIFRQARWVLIPLATCVTTAVIMLGLLSWLDWRLTVISANFVALLLIITLAITIHLAVRYREYIAQHPEWDREHLALATVRFMAKPCLYTALTTIVAFVSLVVSGIRPVIDFGWMMTIGVTLALVLSFLMIPALLMILPKRTGGVSEDNSHAFTLRFARFTERYRGLVLGVALVAAIAGAVGISQLKVENRFIDYFDDSTEIYQGMLVIDRRLGGTITLDIILDKPAEETPAFEGEEDPFAADAGGDAYAEDDPFASDDPFGGEGEAEQSYWFTVAGLAKIEQLHDFLERQPEIGKVQSLATLYKVARDLNGGPLNDFELAVAQNSLPQEINDVLVAPYLSVEHDQARITLRVMETDPDLRRDELIQRVYNYAYTEMGMAEEDIHLTGLLVLYNNMLQSLFKSQILTLGAVFVGILLMFLVLFRSLWLALIALVPNLLAASIVLGGMGLVGIPLDMMTITIAAITVGIGVDHAIHYLYRFRDEFAKDGDYLATMHRSHATIGRAMFYTAITIIAGFSILALSKFVPSIYFGLLTALAMSAALLGSLTLLPLLLLLFKPLRSAEKPEESSETEESLAVDPAAR
ncbi:efflux RND transporter permease subunit [Microbulbifer thermotolerans]|uniref:efflux RND transporter permease subunit n=1 Tax=Microbulbifer thermotolerans TaxID=252514 RepID=UPI0008EA6E79|nr:MMPL family transporter [Microbulbifer thermotolerans]MCX2779197.1 MMPL family transporter [Microbulbifer thermotolerans]MCX2781700.1 MMPL family transporter [Microbulbifer thermotolerans]MCX2793572.1 MMPL family transporter [Microbulbifer thermotolerans]MCX2803621.1 MMPL family transporter [Microbulbifer thermotolerans]MCX2830384.1 MMPL family transporter [Microbulbifer thermotolerans]